MKCVRVCVCVRACNTLVCMCVSVPLSWESIGRHCRGKDMGDQYAGNKQKGGTAGADKIEPREIKVTDREERK